MSASPRVLIVDESSETRQVLREVLQSRGMQILEAQRADEGLALARCEHPDLIVVDLELENGAPQQVSASFAATSHDQHTPLILIGTARVRRTAPPGGAFLQKPYHYAPLIRKIEQLLADAA
ncbi:MAG: response regulator [Pirellulales bacterium]|nr:response regulator [Pirellulales bacterium]